MSQHRTPNFCSTERPAAIQRPAATCWSTTATTCAEWSPRVWIDGSPRASTPRTWSRKRWPTRQQRLDEYLSDPPLPFFGWLRVLAGEHVREAHRKHLFAKGRSVVRESRTHELNDLSMLSLAHQLASNDTSPSNSLMRDEQLEWVKSGLAALPARDREILVMRYVEALSSVEISQALGTTEAGAKNRLYRALMRLRTQMEGSE